MREDLLSSMLNPTSGGIFLNNSSSVANGAWICAPREFPLKPFRLKSRVCFIFSLRFGTSRSSPIDSDLARRASGSLLSFVVWSAAGGLSVTIVLFPDAGCVRLSLMCRNWEGVSMVQMSQRMEPDSHTCSNVKV